MTSIGTFESNDDLEGDNIVTNNNLFSTVVLKCKNRTNRRIKIPCNFKSLYWTTVKEYNVNTNYSFILFEYQIQNVWYGFQTNEGFLALLDALKDVKSFSLFVKIRKKPQHEEKINDVISTQEVNGPFIYYGSYIRMLHLSTNNRLHSHKINYKNGSKQQEATCYWSPDNNDWFQILPDHDNMNKFEIYKNRKVKYGDKIILRHGTSNNYLHSHNVKSPETGQQEVSCYSGKDTNNNWQIMFKINEQQILGNGKYWKINDLINLFHCNTMKALHSHHRNLKEGSKQQEVTCYHQRNGDDNWRVIQVQQNI